MLYLLASYVARKRRAEEVRDSQLTRVGRLRVSQAPGVSENCVCAWARDFDPQSGVRRQLGI